MDRIELVGTNPRRVDGYCVWEVHVNGVMIASFFGGMSFMAATAFIEWMQKNRGMSEAIDIYENLRIINGEPEPKPGVQWDDEDV